MQTKSSKLRRAVTFFKYLGVKTGPKSNRPVSLGTHIAGCFEMPDEWSKSYGTSEMDDTADVFRKPVELASRSYQEMEASLPERHELQGQNVYTNSTFHSNEYNISRMQKAPHRKPVPAPSPNSVKSAAMPFDAPHTMHEDKQRNQVLVSPISPNSPSFPFSPVSPIDESSSYHSIPATTAAVSRHTPGMLNPTCEPFISMQFLRCVSESYLPQLPAYDPNNIASDTPVVATHLQVQELREVVHVLNIEWIRRLSSATHLNLPLPVYYVPSLFETGIVALKKCFENKLPQNLGEVYALIHVACAITYTMHGNDASYDWSGFFQDMLQWQHAILNQTDKLLLVTAINLLWSPEGAPIDFAYENMRDEPYGTNTLETVTPLSFALHAGFQTPFVLNTTQPMEAPYSRQSSESMRLLSMLKNGNTIRDSARFLIGLEYAGIIERTIQLPNDLSWYPQNCRTNIQRMLDVIIKPLQQWSGIETLHDCIKDTEAQMCNGMLRCAREVEVSLVSNGRVSSRQIYERYLEAVTFLCDNYMPKSGTAWREPIYVADLNKVLIISLELDNRRQRASQIAGQLPRSPAPALAHTNRSYSSPNTSFGTPDQTFVSPSPSTRLSKTPAYDSQSAASHSNVSHNGPSEISLSPCQNDIAYRALRRSFVKHAVRIPPITVLVTSANVAYDSDRLTAQNLQPQGNPPRSQLEQWRMQNGTHEQLAVGQKPSRLSEAQRKAQLDELQRRTEGSPS
ncbi:hypothetical protein OEA41_009435 [Lepraria neglecta]|uniref:Uncharacterized protein n=1 Tax=Lepraria neglecta TaxID=209136 RepID=A0AAE0DI14_9LECA|nr:hypothetical protein OEA41_009435 [Lepraria neglecta]